MTAASAGEIEQFIYREADLLDDQRYTDWLELLAEDVVYWVPNFSTDAAPGEYGVIVREDKLGLRARVARLMHVQNPTMKPAARTVHYLTNITMTSESNNTADVRANLLLYVAKAGRVMHHPGRIQYRLVRHDDGLRISLKKINLITNDTALSPLPLI
jgi:3-phenylpropionate/cinnamic acid dioxygenase small subunit